MFPRFRYTPSSLMIGIVACCLFWWVYYLTYSRPDEGRNITGQRLDNKKQSFVRSPQIHDRLESVSRDAGLQTEHVALVSSEPAPVHVVVVEEHHEVIPHWFFAAEHGLIPRSGNVLLHLDGHMDLAPPSIISESMLRWPGPEQLPQFMQSNSRFIMSAAMTGLLTRFIWVVPPWVTDINYFLQSGHFRRQFYAGVTYSKRLPPAEKLRGFDTKTAYALLFAGAPPDQKDDLLKQNVQMSDLQVLPVRAGNIPSAGDGPPLNKSRTHRNREPRLCICFSGNSDGDETSSCFLGEGLSDKKPVFLPATDCQISHSGVVEVVTESKAMELMRPGRGEAERRPWLSEADSVLLDIDEDYYGCEAAIRPLLETGLTEQMVGVVSDYVSRLFCPINSEQESRADAFFNSLVHSVLENVLVCGRNFTCLRNLRARSEKLATMALKEADTGRVAGESHTDFESDDRRPTPGPSS
ncbi:hypothetical protein BaRGS_00010138, partial [Batillaria attramentaria]